MNDLTKLLEDIADGRVPIKYRKALQELINLKGRSLLRAAFYDELLNNPDEEDPLKHAMKSFHVSRATIFRDHKNYRELFGEH